MKGPMVVGRVHQVNTNGAFWIEHAAGRSFAHRNFLVGTKAMPEPGEFVRFWIEGDILPGRRRAACIHREHDEMRPDYEPELQPDQSEVWTGRGTIGEWYDDRGYGRIQPQGRDHYMVYVHMSVVRGVRPWVGAEVEFEAAYGLMPKPNWRATSITVTSKPDDMPSFIREITTRRVYTEEPVRADSRRDRSNRRRRDRWDDD